MFGHQDSHNQDAVAQPQPGAAADDILSHPVAPQTVAPTADSSDHDNDDSGFILTDVAAPSAPAADDSDIPADTAVPAATPPVVSAATGSTSSAPAAVSAPAVDGGLLELKQSALQELTPLIDHLEQTAEEKFRTMMMMIQASDDQSLLADAYHAAQGIEDKKARAQALLDVVNEINYFTQQHHDSSQ